MSCVLSLDHVLMVVQLPIFLGAVVGVMAALVGFSYLPFWGRLGRRLADRKDLRADEVLRNRVQALREMISETVAVSKDLEDYLNGRLAAMEELERRAKDGERAASLTQEQLELVDARLGQQFKRSGRIALWQQLLFTLLGAVIGLAALPVWHWIVG